MKALRWIFRILTLLCCLAALICGGLAFWMQKQVSGENLLTMNSRLGYFVAVNYRWVTLLALFLGLAAAGMVALWILSRRKGRQH